MDYNYLAQKIHEQNKAVGWWDDPNPCIYEKLQLVSIEVAEATEGVRKNLMDDKLKHRVMEEVELADALIRVLDLGYYLGLKYTGVTNIREFEIGNWSTGRRHLLINEHIINLCSYYRYGGPVDSLFNATYSRLIDSIVLVSESKGYNLEEATVEKFAFNKDRADHKKENREKEHGKKF